MRKTTGGVAHIAKSIEEDLLERCKELHKPHVKALADLSASALSCRSANTSEWQSILPRESATKSKETYISRVLSNKLISPQT